MSEELKKDAVQTEANAKHPGRPQKETEFLLFCKWFAQPTHVREEMGWETMDEFAKAHKIHPTTLTRWRKLQRFETLTKEARSEWMKEKTPNVIAALYKRILKYGISTDVELWLSYVEKWDRKQVLEQLMPKLQSDDIRALIAVLPEEEQKPFYELLTTIVAKAKRASGESEDSGDGIDERPEDDQGAVQGQADNVSADAPAGGEVAESPA